PVGRGVVVSLCGGSACAGAPALLEQVHPLLEQLVQILERATLEQHVPVGTRRLDLLGLGRRSADELTLLAVLAHPGAGDLGVVSEGRVVLGPAGRLVLGQPPGCEVGVPVGLVAHRTEAAAAEDSSCHANSFCRGCSLSNAGGPGDVPTNR